MTSDLEIVATPGLGNSAYLLASAGEAVAVDPPRDAWRIAAVAEARGWRIRHVLETHVHNDYLTGARELVRSHGARIAAPATGRYRFRTTPADEAFAVELGDLRVVARATPGHTPEHLAWEVQRSDGSVRSIFTGGSLLMGGVGRTDLLGPKRTPELTRLQWGTVERLRELPDTVEVLPTHGAGSFCVAGSADGAATSTIGALRRWNPAFGAGSLAEFERILAEGRTRYPAYYRHMAPGNRRGPAVLGGPPEVPALSADEVAGARLAGAHLVDVRTRTRFAPLHVAGALNVDLAESFAAYVGWLVPFDAPIVLVVERPADAREAAVELLRIGYERVLGFLAGGTDAWAAAGRPISSYPTLTAKAVARERARARDGAGPRILDVRQPYEWADGVVPGSRQVFVADLPGSLRSLRAGDTPWTVMCKAGTRAGIAASVLDAAGIPVRLVVSGGVPSLPPESLVRP
ncbi:MAG: MBL fold metallo-hydrolase [Chloroflexota bacterium]